MLPSGCSPDLNIWTLIVRTQVNPFLRIGFTGWFWTKHLQHFHHPHLKSVVIFKIQIVTMGNATHAVPGDSLWLGGLGERTVSLWVCCYREFKRLDKRKKVKLNQQKNYKKKPFFLFFLLYQLHQCSSTRDSEQLLKLSQIIILNSPPHRKLLSQFSLINLQLYPVKCVSCLTCSNNYPWLECQEASFFLCVWRV